MNSDYGSKNEPDISFTIAFFETVDVRVETGEDDSDISLSITFLETVDVREKTGKEASDISLSITFLENVDVRVITGINGLKESNGKRNIWFVFICY
jgi:hypothetical protein